MTGAILVDDLEAVEVVHQQLAMGTQTILVIDDDQGVRRSVCSLLEREGYCTLAASNGAEAMKALRESPIDLVITDIVMPDMEGIETCMAIRRQYPRLKIIAMSGATGASDYLAMAQRLGASLTLQKPFGKKELLKAVTGLLAG